MKNGVLENIVKQIAKDLRQGRHKESIYTTSKKSGLRIDVIAGIEQPIRGNSICGNARSAAIYIQSYAQRYPDEMAVILTGTTYSAAMGEFKSE